MNSETKSLTVQSAKAGLISFVLSCLLVLLLALVAKMFTLDGNVLPIVNQVLKIVSVAVGTAISVKEEKFLLKGLLGALLFALLSLALFLLLGGSFNIWQVLLDFAIALIVAAVVAFVKSRKK